MSHVEDIIPEIGMSLEAYNAQRKTHCSATPNVVTRGCVEKHFHFDGVQFRYFLREMEIDERNSRTQAKYEVVQRWGLHPLEWKVPKRPAKNSTMARLRHSVEERMAVPDTPRPPKPYDSGFTFIFSLDTVRLPSPCTEEEDNADNELLEQLLSPPVEFSDDYHPPSYPEYQEPVNRWGSDDDLFADECWSQSPSIPDSYADEVEPDSPVGLPPNGQQLSRPPIRQANQLSIEDQLMCTETVIDLCTPGSDEMLQAWAADQPDKADDINDIAQQLREAKIEQSAARKRLADASQRIYQLEQRAKRRRLEAVIETENAAVDYAREERNMTALDVLLAVALDEDSEL